MNEELKRKRIHRINEQRHNQLPHYDRLLLSNSHEFGNKFES